MTSKLTIHVTGNPRIDREHETLVHFIEQARGICDVGNPSHCGDCTLTTRDRCSTTMNIVMDALASYMRQHFRYEEQLMDLFTPNDHAVGHRRDHELIVERLRDVTDEMDRETASAVSAQIMIDVLGAWLEHHFYEFDEVLAALVGDENDNDADPAVD
jgi:hemerythrin-like metal-binding protein